MNNIFAGRPSRVWSHGKWIEVGYLNDPPKNKGKRPRKQKSFKIDWVKLPNYWIEQLDRCQRLGTIKLAHRILREAYKRQYLGGEVVLSVAVTGLPRSTRRRAVEEMVKLGLIHTQQEGNKAVVVTELLLGDDKPKRARRGKNGK